jgi:hypothetical protein
MRCTRALPILALGGTLAFARVARADDVGAPVRVSPLSAAGVWTAMQLVPSPLFVVGTGNAGGGVRWQVTPIVYSFGIAEKPVRAFVVEPVARHAGAVELYVSPEWACCAAAGTSWIGRGGARLYLPLVGRGESLSGSVGASYYRASGGDGLSMEMGAYALFGTVGLTITFSPTLAGRETILALALRYF